MNTFLKQVFIQVNTFLRQCTSSVCEHCVNVHAEPLSVKLVAGSASCSAFKSNILRCSSCMRDALVVLSNTQLPPRCRRCSASPSAAQFLLATT